MNGVNCVGDTNIFMYFINGNPAVSNYKDVHFYISEITEIELLGKQDISKDEHRLRADMIETCTIVNLTDRIKNITIKLKQKYNIKVPDAIIAATAIYLNLPFVTADKGFKKIQELDLQLLDLK
jgi:predicted nucleic acid-binding protein